MLPSVDKDVGDFFEGRGPGYAWVQTSETIYLFAPIYEFHFDERGEKVNPEVELDLQDEGNAIRFVVEGKEILNGHLAHAIKPGNHIWMIEEAPDGNSFAVCELDKQTLGLEWTSVMKPQVDIIDDYSKAIVEATEFTEEQEAAMVDDTLQHLVQEHRQLKATAEGHAASPGDVLTVDMQGFELNEDGSRGGALEVGSAQGVELKLGKPGFSKEMQDGLVGIKECETREVKVSLGRQAGGQMIICSVTCAKIKEQTFPELNDDFAKAVKREEQFKQAGTAEGIPEEEEGLAEVFSLADLRKEISHEVRAAAQMEAKTDLDAQLTLHLRRAIKVSCDWANLKPEAIAEEELAAIIHAVANREDLHAKIDLEDIKKQTWDKLAEPDPGEDIKEVGKDPQRDFQAAHQVLLRKRLHDEVLAWLRPQSELVPADEGQ